MAVEACMNPKMVADDSDDEKPIVFRRKSNQISSELKNSSPSVIPEKRSLKPVSDVRSTNDRNSSALKGRMDSLSKPSSSKPTLGAQKSPPPLSKPIKSPPSSTRPSPSSVRPSPSPPPSARPSPSPPPSARPSPSPPPSKVPPVKPPSNNGSYLANHQSRKAIHGKEQKRAPNVVKEGNSAKDEYDNSDDDKPISARYSVGQRKGNSDAANVVVKSSNSDSVDSDDDKPIGMRMDKGKVVAGGSQTQKLKASVKPPNDSDDEKPLSSKLMKNNSGISSRKYDDSDEDKPLASKLQQNGSIKKENQSKKVHGSSVKRSSESSVGQSSIKKAKLSEASTSSKAKQTAAKSGVKDDDDHISIGLHSKAASSSTSVPVKKVAKIDSSKLRLNKNSKKIMKKSKFSKSSKELPNSGDGQKWTTLVHNGVIFPPPYQPHGVKMLYNGKPVDLTPEQEEVATMYAVMLETDYVKKEKFSENFFGDWKKILGKNHVIQDFSKCDFKPIYEWHLREKEKKKQMSAEEKKAIKEEKSKLEEKYMWAILDGVKEKVGNFRVEPPGLFRGRGEHPKMGKLKKRIYPKDITINIGKDAPIPECPMPGQKWKEIRHDNTVTWLAYWNDPINQKEFKYVFLAASSSLKGQSDKEKYEKARKLKDYIQGIRSAYTKDFTNKDMAKKQIAVATYLIDRLALRAGNEKDDDEADTVGCCTLKFENVKPIPPNILEFDFLGKDSIKYYKQFEADPRVYKAVEEFRKGKSDGEDLFDKLDTSKLNAHLKELMPGLTAKVFRTYNASFTLDDMLGKGAGSGEVPEKIAIYQQANKEVAIICNHQRTVSKSHSSMMERLATRIEAAKAELKELEVDLARAKKGKPPLKDSSGKQKRTLFPEAIEKKILSTKAKIEKQERDMQSKEDLKEIALGTSKINYCDPRITVAWCKRNEVPIEKMFNKSLLEKFAWAMDCDPSFRF
ncbi:DNA topoisomerase 1 alpha-like [Amaranthus tricolor]|uniref:DNA topoisomerase 1 alpha-like n=1 Tax=Amaranthus tricolor TaxID=29722 RepID=UPI00258EB4E1|nr:DNA topoisomerase 1 alpha-like [Amaranthus tricolor]XP_057540486.1 DNA topoisomerase 1 alpha-like [Amaranthus tricolor]XP_057540487.1 DNA topoisomerase 1 alpha-like [Amaranthus tricolor]